MSHAPLPVALIVVHGWAGSAAAWDPVIRAYRDAGVESVHAVRLPGSPGAQNADAFTVRAAADETVRAAELIDGPVALIGHSMGAQVTLLAHRRLSERLIGEVVVDPAYGADDTSRDSHREWSARISRDGHAAVRDFFASALGNLSVLDAARVISDLERTAPSVIAEYLWSEYVAPDAVGLASATRRHAATRSAPVLAIHSRPAGHAFESSLPNPHGSRSELWEGLGHFLHLEEPQRFVRTTLAFLGDSDTADR